MKGVPRGVFDRAVQASGAERYHKCFSSWNHLTAMVVGHLSGATSLRTLERTYNSQTHQHYHLGTGPLRRSTLADANAKRSMAPFEAVAQALMAQAHRTLRREGQALLYLLDSTPIPLAGRHFDAWTQANRTQRTQGLKLHLLIAQPGAKPLQCAFSAANVNDITYGKSLPIETGATYVFDKGYCDFGWWAAIDAAGARFVTRFKRNVALVQLRQRPVSAADQGVILADEVVHFAPRKRGKQRDHGYRAPLRRITVARPNHSTPLVLATNDLDAPARVLAQHYKERWGIELLFKWLKQHLKITQFYGRSQNAVKIQILCALIAYLLLAIYRQLNGSLASLWMVLAELRATLFQRPTTDSTVHRRSMQRRTASEQLQGRLFT